MKTAPPAKVAEAQEAVDALNALVNSAIRDTQDAELRLAECMDRQARFEREYREAISTLAGARTLHAAPRRKPVRITKKAQP